MPAHTPAPEGRRLSATEARCSHLTDEQILHIYHQTTPSTRGGGKRAVKSGSISDMANRFGIIWSDVQQIYRGYAFAWITGADKARRRLYRDLAPAMAAEDSARAKLSDAQIRYIRIMARGGPLDPVHAPNTYKSLGARFDLHPNIIRAVRLRKILVDVPDVPDAEVGPAGPKPTPGNASGDHWM